MMKKLLLLIFFLTSYIYALEINNNLYLFLGINSHTHILKEEDKVVFKRFGFYKGERKSQAIYEEKSMNDFTVCDDGWYEAEMMVIKIIPIFGGNYFFFHDPLYPESGMYDETITKYMEYALINRKDHYGNDTFCGDRKRIIKEIKVPDVLIENSRGTEIVYDTWDMEHYYIYLDDGGGTYCNAHAKPWATSKEPVGMKIEMSFIEKVSAVTILNGYANPLKRHLYKANRRLKKIRITSLDPGAEFSMEEEIEDVVHFHEIELPLEADHIEIEILEYYEGDKYKDLCVQMFGLPFEFNFYEKDDYSSIRKSSSKWNGNTFLP